MYFVIVIVHFPLDEDPDVSMIAWTTTPWTLPSNLALVVNPNMDYVKVKGIFYYIFVSHAIETCTLVHTCRSARFNGKIEEQLPHKSVGRISWQAHCQ